MNSATSKPSNFDKKSVFWLHHRQKESSECEKKPHVSLPCSLPNGLSSPHLLILQNICVVFPVSHGAPAGRVMRGGLQWMRWLLGPVLGCRCSAKTGQWERLLEPSWQVPAGPSLGPHLLQLGPRSPKGNGFLIFKPLLSRREFQQNSHKHWKSLVWFGKTFHRI